MNKPASQQMEVQIMGQGYVLACPQGGEALLMEAVERVDTAMCRIRDAGKVKARERIAVLASLNLAFELCQHQRAPQARAGQANAATADGQAQTEHRDLDAPTQERIADLIRRLDHALSRDGQLL